MIFIADVSPTWSNTLITQDGQSVSGRTLSLAVASDGQMLYAGTFSNVWLSTDSGKNFAQVVRPQPPPDTFGVPDALGGWGVFGIAVSPADPSIVVAVTRNDLRDGDHGIYRSTDGGGTWKLAHQFADRANRAGQIVWAPDDPNLIYAAGGTSVAISRDGGASFVDVLPWGAGFGSAFHVAVAPALPSLPSARVVYALGNGQIWLSRDGGNSWTQDGGMVPNAGSATGSFQANAPCVMVIVPFDPRMLIVEAEDGGLWLGNYAQFDSQGNQAQWTSLPIPALAEGEAAGASGVRFLAVSQTVDRPLLFYSAGENLFVAPAPPRLQSDWLHLDPSQSVHVDLHGLFLSPDFDASIDNQGYHANAGTLWLLSDGGVSISTDGGMNFHSSSGLSTLGVVNLSGVSQPGRTALCIGTGDNWGFYSLDGGTSWKTQDYDGGDNDCSYADPLQPDRMMVFTPRDGTVTVYVGDQGKLPDGSSGTQDRHSIPAAPDVTVPPGGALTRWSAVSPFALRGFRPIVLSVPGEAPPLEGDYIFIRFKTDEQGVLLRTQSILDIDSPNDWDTTELSPFAGARVFQVGPVLPSPNVGVAQASGGHAATVYYVGEFATKRLWKWTTGMTAWQLLVPPSRAVGTALAERRVSAFSVAASQGGFDYAVGDRIVLVGGRFSSPMVLTVAAVEGGAVASAIIENGGSYIRIPPNPIAQASTSGSGSGAAFDVIWQAAPFGASRFFVDPYRPSILFILDSDHVKRSDDGGMTWVVDAGLEQQLTSGGQIRVDHVEASSDGSFVDTLLNDMQFDPVDGLTRFAVGIAGAFFTVDGVKWNRLFDTGALSGLPTSCYYDAYSNPCRRALYVGMAGRGVLKLTQLPWGSLQPPDPDTWVADAKIPNQRTKKAPALAVFNGLIHMVHVGDSSDSLYWSMSPDGITWQRADNTEGDQIIVPNQKSPAAPALAVLNGRLFLVHLAENSKDIFISSFDGTSWTHDQKIPNMTTQAAPALAAFNGVLHLVHLGESSSDIYWSTSADGVTWNRNDGTQGDQKLKGQLSQATPSLAVFDGKLQMIHHGDGTNDIWWSVFDGANWWPNTRIRCQMSSAPPAICTQGGLLHMVHLGDGSSDLWWSVYDGTAWTPDQVIPSQKSQAQPALSPTPDGSSLVMVHLGASAHDLWHSQVTM
jgi:hypothetical protein